MRDWELFSGGAGMNSVAILMALCLLGMEHRRRREGVAE